MHQSECSLNITEKGYTSIITCLYNLSVALTMRVFAYFCKVDFYGKWTRLELFYV